MNHKHLRVAVEDVCTQGLSQDLTLRLINEFRYSNLYLPAKRDENGLNFIIYEDDDGLKLTPLFTNPDEFSKFFKDTSDIELMQNSFELYQNVLRTNPNLEGYILNPASENYVFLKDFVLDIKNVPKTNYFSTDTYSPEELKKLKYCQNDDLEDFIKNPNNVGEFEALFEVMSNSTLLTLMLSDTDLAPRAKDGIISMMDSGPLAEMCVDDVGGVYATLFTSEDKIRDVKTDSYKYSQVVNLSMLVNFVLSEDMDGIILNFQTDDVLIPRATLLRYSRGFEKFANDMKLGDAMFYMFLID